jgi:glucokinase
MARRYGELAGLPEPIEFKAVVERARDRDPIARDVVLEGASILGRSIGGLVNVLDPQAVVLGGGVILAGEAFLEPFERGFRAELLPGPRGVAVRLARFGSRSGLIGAAMTAMTDRGATADDAAPAVAGEVAT